MTNAIASIQTSNTGPERSATYVGALPSIIAKAPRREMLLRVARQEFATHGFLAATLATIAHQAGIRKSTIFHYFQTKEDLYDGAVTRALDELADALESAARVASSESALSRIDSILTALALAFAHEPAIARLVLRAMVEGNVVARTQGQEKPAMERIVGTIAAAIRAGVDEGQLARCAPVQEATAIVYVVCASHAVVTPPSAAGGAAGEIDEPVLIGVTDAQRAAATATQARRLLQRQA